MLADLGFVASLAWISAGLGDRLLNLFNSRPAHPSDRFAQATPLGMGMLALGIFVLGLFGQLDRFGLVVLLILVASLGAVPGARLLIAAYTLTLGKTARILRRGSAIERGLIGLTILALIGTALVTTMPVTDGDALCYHLQIPKIFLAKKAIVFEPDLHETVYPLLAELLNAIALEFRGPEACRGIQFLLGLIFATNVTMLARPVLQGHAWWAGAIALLVPAISNGMTAPLNDVALAAFGTAAIATTLRSIDHPSVRSAALAGCFVGLALGVKYPAIVLLGLLTLTIVANALIAKNPGRRLDSVPMALAFLLSALAVGGCWYFRAWWNTGNPVFPYFRHVFGGSGLDEVLDPTRRSMIVTPWSVLTAIVPMTLSPDRFESFAHQFGPLFLLVLPALTFERPPRRVVLLAAIGYAFLMICVTQRQSMRFVLTALGPLSVGVAYMLRRWSTRPTLPNRLILTTLLLALGMESGQAVARCRNALPMILGRENREQFLLRREPTYRVGRWIDRHLPESSRLIGQDHRGFYIPRDYTMELAHRRRTKLGRRGESSNEVVDHFRQSGFTHLLLCPPIPESALEFDPTLSRALEPWLAHRTPLFREDLADADGVVRRYSIYSLDESGAAVSANQAEKGQVTR